MPLTAPWAVPADMEFTACSDAEPDAVLPSLALASEILYELSGRRWGGSGLDVVRPCSPLRGGGLGWCGCESPRLCGCASPSFVELPGVPVLDVVSVWLDGEELTPTAYRVTGQYLLRTDGGRWPCCQDLAVGGRDPGGWEVAYHWGASPPPGGVMAAAALACELYKGQTGDTGCRLPKRVTTVTRQGITFAMIDPLTVFADGMTGVPEVDLWLSAYRLGERSRGATVMIPGRRARNLRDL